MKHGLYRHILAILVSVSSVAATACGQQASASPILPGPPVLTTPYTAVFLTNGQAFFGHLENLGSPYPVLSDVYYVQSRMNQDTKEVKNTLIKRGSEWHAPDRMVINAEHILFVEPVTKGSTVSKLIEALKANEK